MKTKIKFIICTILGVMIITTSSIACSNKSRNASDEKTVAFAQAESEAITEKVRITDIAKEKTTEAPTTEKQTVKEEITATELETETTTEEPTTEVVTLPPQTQPQTQAPTIVPTIAPTQPQTEAPTPKKNSYSIYGITVNEGEWGYTKHERTLRGDDGSTLLQEADAAVYYATSKSDAEQSYKEYMNNTISSGKYSRHNELIIVFDGEVEAFASKVNATNNLYNMDVIPHYSQANSIYNLVYNLNESLVKHNVSFAWTFKQPDYYKFYFDFYNSGEEYAKCQARAKEIVAKAKNKDNVYDQLKCVYDSFANAAYELVTREDQGVYSAFFSNKTVCAGICKALSLCYNEMGYDTELVCCHDGQYSPHMYLQINIDGKWYLIEGTETLKGGGAVDTFLLGKDMLKSFKVLTINKETQESFLEYTNSNNRYDISYFIGTSSNSAVNELADTSFDIDKSIDLFFSAAGKKTDRVKNDYVLMVN